jgi:hypothetical protein
VNRGFDSALASWETGGLSRDELVRRYPGEDVAGLLTAFERMQAAATGPTPDPASAWEAIRPQLPVRLTHRRVPSRGIRLLAAALVALLAMGATAYAFVPGVRRAIGDAFGSVTGSETAPHRPATTDVGTAIDDPAPDLGSGFEAVVDEASPGMDERNDEREDRDEDQGSAQEQGEDEGDRSERGSEAGGDGASGEDQGTQVSGSEEGPSDADGGGSGGSDNGSEGPEQPEDGDSGN